MAIPAPFSRPAVDLGGHQRSWRNITAKNLHVGDNVLGYGILTEILITKDIQDLPHVIRFRTTVGTTANLLAEQVVKAHTLG